MKILLDNGHGIDTPGKRSPDGLLREYAWNRLIASRISFLSMIWLSKSVLVSFFASKTTNYLIIKQEGTLRKVSFHKVTDAEFQGDGIKCISKNYDFSKSNQIIIPPGTNHP